VLAPPSLGEGVPNPWPPPPRTTTLTQVRPGHWRISRAGAALLVGGGTALHVVAVYALVVLGGGALLGSRGPSLPLAVLATGVVAVTLEPVRHALSEHLAPSPYDLLTRFTTQVSGAVPVGDLAPTMARLLGQGTSARRVEVWLEPSGSPGGGELIGRWPHEALPILPGVGVHVHPVRHGVVALGHIVRDCAPAPGRRDEPLNPVEQRLLDDLLASAGLALRTLALTRDLERRIAETTERAAELRESRSRIVTAADAARHRLERDIHDGAQQHLVALAVKLSLAVAVTRRDPELAASMMGEMAATARTALETLDELSRGIYPRTLTDSGLGPALAAATSTSPVPVQVRDLTGRRYPVEVEAAVYFVALEAVQNSVKHACASSVAVEFSDHPGLVRFDIRDDGIGFRLAQVAGGVGLGGMRDRVESLGGQFHLRTCNGAGTSVSGWMPVPLPTTGEGGLT
jgi:signal transduction histidine kinase